MNNDGKLVSLGESKKVSPKNVKKEERFVRETREIYPGVRVKKKDAQKFVNDMMKGDNPMWEWVVRIGVLSANAFIVFMIVKGGF